MIEQIDCPKTGLLWKTNPAVVDQVHFLAGKFPNKGSKQRRRRRRRQEREDNRERSPALRERAVGAYARAVEQKAGMQRARGLPVLDLLTSGKRQRKLGQQHVRSMRSCPNSTPLAEARDFRPQFHARYA